MGSAPHEIPGGHHLTKESNYLLLCDRAGSRLSRPSSTVLSRYLTLHHAGASPVRATLEVYFEGHTRSRGVVLPAEIWLVRARV
jgi:hypothetical protein